MLLKKFLTLESPLEIFRGWPGYKLFLDLGFQKGPREHGRSIDRGMLDIDNSGQLNIEEFCEGVIQPRGCRNTAHKLDICVFL